MRRRNIITMVLAAGMAMSVSFCSFAGEWKQDAAGWLYQNTDSSYLSDGWYWIGGRSYYFNSEGYCLTSTTTPDGYTVDDSGAWIVDGAVQEKATEEVLSSIKVLVPNGYDCIRDDESGSIELYETKGSDQGILIMTMQEDDISYVRTVLGEEYLKEISDLAVKGIMSVYSDTLPLVSTSKKTYSTGVWNYYLYQGMVDGNEMVSLDFYTHFTDNEIRMVVFLKGAGREFTTTDEFMANCIR